MAAVSSLGIGSGLDLNALLAGIKAGEQAPLAALQKQQTSYTTKLTAYGQLSGALSGLQSAAAALAKPELFQGVKASSTASDVLTATALSTASSGTYNLNVTQLSQAQSLATTGQATSSANIGDDSTATRVQFEFGTTSGTAFAGDATRTQSLDIDPAHSSLADIAKAINAKTTLGVTASIVNDGSGSPFRLVLTSTKTGEASSMRITVSGDPVDPAQPDGARGPGDAALSGLLTNDPAASKTLQQTVAAQNTKLTVNGIAITSATNSVTGAIQDVTLSVSKIGTTTVSVQQDSASVQSAVTNFVSAYNSLQSVANRLTAFDPASKSGAVLLGDSTLRNIQMGIRSALTTAQTPDDSGLTMLSQIGISFQKDGTLAIDSSKLTAALGSKMSGVAHLFSGGAGGFGTKMSALVAGYTDTTGGVLTAATKGINKTLDSLAKQYSATSERVEATVARYKAQFTQLDTMMSRMNQTSSYLTQQFDSLNNSNKK
ncbi:flagellar filament capping protein FliD [Polaromonas sp. CG_9.11]|uniref:flagellar filament capping protein FliD n=1 Tax=Polaromonas sp. CG_9.11 TaxID=2787730 RepID=UPI0018CA59CD|nr:flagellar filament capping protein FliD [Polaromonas sp. CG_9.11]MBG6077616.1 flagellar hook-associated protein 2 [Polaromonas sp. CG_9.11]